MKKDHIKIRNSDITNPSSSSRITGLSTMNTTLKTTPRDNDVEEDMPFAMAASSVKYTPKKSLMIAANNMVSPKAMRITRNSITFDNRPSTKVEEEMNATTMSFRY